MAAIDEDQGRIARSLNGDHDAFEALVLEHQRMIHSLCYRMTGSIADAEDLAQETFVHAFARLGEFRAEARFSSWLYRIAVNQCLNWQKRRQCIQRLHEAWENERRVEPSNNESNHAQARQIQNALLRLDPRQRAAVILTTYDGLTHAQAARVLGCSETTVSWRLFAARRKLKRWLTPLSRTQAR